MKSPPFWKRLLYLPEFAIYYLWEVIQSNLRVAYDVVTPNMRGEPAIIALDVEGLTPRQKFALANLLTMTPGTLSLDLSSDHACLYVHALFAEDPSATARDLENQLVRRVCRIF